jgi:hypothetical protein
MLSVSWRRFTIASFRNGHSSEAHIGTLIGWGRITSEFFKIKIFTSNPDMTQPKHSFNATTEMVYSDNIYPTLLQPGSVYTRPLNPDSADLLNRDQNVLQRKRPLFPRLCILGHQSVQSLSLIQILCRPTSNSNVMTIEDQRWMHIISFPLHESP